MLKSCVNITKTRYPVAIEGIINSDPQIIFSINPHMRTPQNKCSVEIPQQYWCKKVPCKVVPSNLSHLKRTIRHNLVKFE